MADFRKSSNQKIEMMLTDEQKTKWKELIGAEFKDKEKIDLRG